MADDISKNISIQITAETDKLEQSIGNLNKIIAGLQKQQKQLAKAGKTSSEAFKNNADKIDIFNKSLQNASAQLNGFKTALSSATGSLQENKTLIAALTTAKERYSKSLGDNTKKIQELNSAIKLLSTAGKEQQSQTIQSSSVADKHGQSLANSAKQAKTATTDINAANAALNKQTSTANNTKNAVDKHSKSLTGTAKQAKNAGNTINAASSALNKQTSAANSSKNAVEGHAKTMGDAAKQAKGAKTAVGSVNTVLSKQKAAVQQSKTAFDLHKATMDQLKASFDEIKGISGEFGPSLQDVATGFNMMKSGLDIMKGGIEGIGAAIKADGFDFLLQILNYLFEAFVKSSTGGKLLQGVISAIGVVVNEVKTFVNDLTDIFIKAFSHPVETIKELGKMIMENLINRFTSIGTILDGIIHFDFKKVANGAIQAVTGVTDATDKIGTALKTAKDGVVKTAGEMVIAFNNGTTAAGQAVDNHEQKVKKSVARQIKYYKKLKKHVKAAYSEQKKDDVTTRGAQINILPPPVQPTENKNSSASVIAPNNNIRTAPTSTTGQAATDLKSKLSKTMDDIEKRVKQSWQTLATDGINALEKSIERQSAIKIAALQKDEAAELNNTSLTSTQKLAIQQKYQQQINKVKAKAFKEEQELNIAKALMTAAVAEVKLWDDPGFPGVVAMTVALAAQTAAQIAQIASQKPPAYASGGLHYASDGRGGVLPGYSRTDNTNAFLRSGEGIVVSEAMREPWARNLVSAINVGFGGRDFSTTTTGRGFAVGGIFTDGGNANRYYNQPVNDNKNLANTIAYQMINNFPPVYVDVKDINNQQNILAQTINRVNL